MFASSTVSARCVQSLAAGAALVIGCTAAAASDAQTPPPHTLRTNIPGVYAFPQPPAGFDPLEASQAQLAGWGYPPRPAVSEGPAALARWAEDVKPKLLRVIPDLVRSKGVYHRPATGLRVTSRPSGLKAGSATSYNWSGYALLPASGAQPFYYVKAGWIVPTVKQAPGTCSGGWDYSSHWVGIGGYDDAYLLQAGSAADVYCDVGNNIPEYFPWLEWLPQSELVIYQNAATSTLYPFAPGDYLVVAVWATNFSDGVSTTGNLSFQDRTQGWSFALTFSASSVGGSEVTGQSAEWIVERTEVDGSLATLPNYFADSWWYTQALDLGGVAHYPGAPAGSGVYNITMVDNNDANISYVDLFGNDALWFFPEGSATK